MCRDADIVQVADAVRHPRASASEIGDTSAERRHEVDVEPLDGQLLGDAWPDVVAVDVVDHDRAGRRSLAVEHDLLGRHHVRQCRRRPRRCRRALAGRRRPASCDPVATIDHLRAVVEDLGCGRAGAR